MFISGLTERPVYSAGTLHGFKMPGFIYIITALRNHNQIVFEEMSSWTALIWNIGMETVF